MEYLLRNPVAGARLGLGRPLAVRFAVVVRPAQHQQNLFRETRVSKEEMAANHDAAFHRTAPAEIPR